MSRLPSPRQLRTATTGARAVAGADRGPRPRAPATRTRGSTSPRRAAERAEHRPHHTGCGVGIDALASPICAHAIRPPLITSSGREPKKAGRQSTRSASLPTSIEPIVVRDAVRDRRVDRVLRDVAPDPEVVVGAVAGERAALLLHLVRGLPGPQHDLADPAHRLAVARDHADRAEVVQDVLGGDRLAADPALGERDVLGQPSGSRWWHTISMSRCSSSVLTRERPGRVGRARQDVRDAAHLDDVGRVAAAGALGVVRVDRPAGERGDRVVDEAGLVERVGVDRDLHVARLGDREAAVDRRRRGAPVLVQLEARPRRPGTAPTAPHCSPGCPCPAARC